MSTLVSERPYSLIDFIVYDPATVRLNYIKCRERLGNSEGNGSTVAIASFALLIVHCRIF